MLRNQVQIAGAVIQRKHSAGTMSLIRAGGFSTRLALNLAWKSTVALISRCNRTAAHPPPLTQYHAQYCVCRTAAPPPPPQYNTRCTPFPPHDNVEQ
eukprot:2902648-Rhodomonas_salina.1